MVEFTRDEFNQAILDLIKTTELGSNEYFLLDGDKDASEGFSIGKKKHINNFSVIPIYFNKIKLIDSKEELDMLKEYEYESDKEEPLYLTKDTPKLNSLIDSKLFEGIPLYWRDLHLSTIDVSEKKCFQDLLGSYGTAIVNLSSWDFSKAVTLNRLGLRSASYKDSRLQYSMVIPSTFFKDIKNVEDLSCVGSFKEVANFDEIDLSNTKKIYNPFNKCNTAGKIKITKKCKYVKSAFRPSTLDFSESDFTGLSYIENFIDGNGSSNTLTLPPAENFGDIKPFENVKRGIFGKIIAPDYESYLASGMELISIGSSYNGKQNHQTPLSFYKEYNHNARKCAVFNGLQVLKEEVWCTVMAWDGNDNYADSSTVFFDGPISIEDFESFRKKQIEDWPEEEYNAWSYKINNKLFEDISEVSLKSGDVILLLVNRATKFNLSVSYYKLIRDFPFAEKETLQFKTTFGPKLDGGKALDILIDQFPELKKLDLKNTESSYPYLNTLKYSGWSGTIGKYGTIYGKIEDYSNKGKSIEGKDVIGEGIGLLAIGQDGITMDGKYPLRNATISERALNFKLYSSALGFAGESWMLPGAEKSFGSYTGYNLETVTEAVTKVLPYKLKTVKLTGRNLYVEPEVVYYKTSKLPIYKDEDTLKDVLSTILDLEKISQVSINILDTKGNLITEDAPLDTIMNGEECIEIKEGTCEVRFLEKVETLDGIDTKVLRDPIKISEVKTLYDILEEEKNFEFPSYIESAESIRKIYINGFLITDLDTDLLKDDSIEIVYSYKNYHEEEKECNVNKVVIQVEQGECKFKFKFKNIDFDANPWGQSVDCVCDNGWGSFNINPWMHNGDGYQGYLGNPDRQGNCIMSIWTGEPWIMEIALKDSSDFGFDFEGIINAKLLTVATETVKVLN